MKSIGLSILLLALAQHVHARDAVFEPQEPTPVHIWTGTDGPDFVYPEQSEGDFGMPSLIEKPSFGIAVSGGGYRATTLAYGWLRAMYELGYTRKARYLASNSGGSWFNGAYSYTQVPFSQFFSPYLPPEALTLKACQQLPAGSYGAAIARGTIVGDALTSIPVELFSSTIQRVRLWSDAVGEAFLEPFGVGAQASSVTAVGTRGRVHERVAKTYPNLTFAVATSTPDRPYPIILGSLFRDKEPQKFYPFEFTPLYFGVPSSSPNAKPTAVGGGFTEPFGTNSIPASKNPGPSPDGSKAMDVSPLYMVPLVTAVGISSSFVAQGITPAGDIGEIITGTEVLDYWSLIDFNATENSFADGGGIDNLAVTPLLRRKVKHIVVAVAAVMHPDTNASDWAVGQYDISGLFGAVPPGPMKSINNVSIEEWNKNLQVFPQEDWPTFYQALENKVAQGEPGNIRATYKVLDNERQAIQGGWEVDILWLINTRIDTWEKALPSEMQALLKTHRKGGVTSAVMPGDSSMRNYPYISTFDANYDPELVSLLSQQASWQVLQSKKDLDDMAAGPPA